MSVKFQMFDAEEAAGSLWQFVSVDRLITLPLSSWTHGTRLHNAQAFWLLTDGICFKIQQKPGASQHLAMLRLRPHAGRVQYTSLPQAENVPIIMKISTERAPTKDRRLNRGGYFEHGKHGEIGDMVFKFDVAHENWAGGEDYVKLCELFQKEIGQLITFNAEESSACWTTLMQRHADKSMGTPLRRQDNAIAGPSSSASGSNALSLPPTASHIDLEASQGGPSTPRSNPSGPASPPAPRAGTASAPIICTDDVITAMLDLTEKARLYTASQAARAENMQELTRLRQRATSMELEVETLQADLQRSKKDADEQKEAAVAAERLRVDSFNNMKADYEAKLVRAENKLSAATQETEQLTTERNALAASLEAARKQNLEQERAIQDLELDARENAERITELTAEGEAFKAQNASRASALRFHLKKLYKESLEILQEDISESSTKKRRIE